MYSSRKTKILNIICVLLVLTTGVIRLTRASYRSVSSSTLIFFLFILSGLIWLVQIRRRVIRPEERKYLELTAVLLLFLIIIKTVKYVFVPSGSWFSRYIWYLYYFPQTFIVVSMLFAVLHTGLAYGTQMDQRWKLLYIPAAAIVGGILTNDLHQLAFSFPQGIEMWDELYVHGPLYFVSIIWVVLLFIIMITIALRRCATMENRHNIWMPIIPLAIGIIYMVMFLMDHDMLLHRLFKTTEVIGFIFPAFMEALIQAGLFPTNDGYENLWKISGLQGGIMDNDGRVLFESDSSISVSKDMIREAEEFAVLLQNGNLVLGSHAIGGGYVYWLKDLTEINEINNKLAELGKILEEDNALLCEEKIIAENKTQIQLKNRIYDSIYSQIAPQLRHLENILETVPDEEDVFEEKMKYGAVLVVFIKRCSNLILLMHQKEKISTGEFQIAVEESLRYIRLNGVRAIEIIESDMELSGSQILFMYTFFENVTELILGKCTDLLVSFECSEEICLRIEAQVKDITVPVNFMYDRIEEFSGVLQIENEQDTIFLTLTLPGNLPVEDKNDIV